MDRDAKSQGHKAKIHYAAIRKRNRKGEWIWGVVRYEGRQQKWGTVGPGDEGKRDARQAALQLNRDESRKCADGERYLDWHRQGQPLPLDRTVRHYARAKKSTVASSTALRYAQFAERLAERLGDREVSRLTEEDIGEFIRAEHAADRAQDPTINACIMLRGAIRLALHTKDAKGQTHLADDPLPLLTKIAKRTARALWIPTELLLGLTGTDSWTLAEVKALLETAKRINPRVYGVCLFQYLTGARIGEALATPWAEVDLKNGTLRFSLRIHRGKVGNLKTRNSLRTIQLPDRLIHYLRHLRSQRPSTKWVFPQPRRHEKPWSDMAYQKAWRRVRDSANVRSLGTHAWRHAHISLALENGKDPAWIAERCGTSIEMIFRRYGHAVKREGKDSFDYLSLD
jgi:integrase